MHATLREGPPGREELLDGWMDQWISGGKNVCPESV